MPCGGAKTLQRMNERHFPKPSRKSCKECVEKHIGAAIALFAEAFDGHASRLRAIGHLHEAADESQEWWELHDAIRAARMEYQRTGKMPNWENLARLLAEVPNAE